MDDVRFLPPDRLLKEVEPGRELKMECNGVSSSSSEVRTRPNTPDGTVGFGADKPEGPGCKVELRCGILTGANTGLVSSDPKSPYKSSTSKSSVNDGFGQGAIVLPVDLLGDREAEATKV